MVGSDNDGNNVGNSTASEDQNVELSEVERGGDYATNDVEPAPNLLDNEGNPVKNYPLPSHPNDRRAEFENALMRGYMTKRASEGLGEEPERVYQSEFDKKFHLWCDRNWERWQNTRIWAEEKAPRALWTFDKIHGIMFAIGEKACDGLGLNQSRYQWVIDAAEREAFEEERERLEEEEALAEQQAEQDRQAAEEAAALEGGTETTRDSQQPEDTNDSQHELTEANETNVVEQVEPVSVDVTTADATDVPKATSTEEEPAKVMEEPDLC